MQILHLKGNSIPHHKRLRVEKKCWEPETEMKKWLGRFDDESRQVRYVLANRKYYISPSQDMCS